jgi:hypothetical protein
MHSDLPVPGVTCRSRMKVRTPRAVPESPLLARRSLDAVSRGFPPADIFTAQTPDGGPTDQQKKGMSCLSTVNDHLVKHNAGKVPEAPRIKHQEAKDAHSKQLLKAIENGMTLQCYKQLRFARMVIRKFLSFQISKDEDLRAFAHPSWDPWNAEMSGAP